MPGDSLKQTGWGRQAAPLETRRRAASDGPDFSGPPC